VFEDQITLRLTVKEKKLIEELVILPDDYLEKLAKSEKSGSRFLFILNYDEMDEILGYLSSEANALADSKKGDDYDKICDKFQDAIQ